MPTATITFLGTGKYFSFFADWYQSCCEKLLVDCDKHFLVFTDHVLDAARLHNASVFATEHERWPFVTLKRYETIRRGADIIRRSDFFLFLDADMIVAKPLTRADLFSDAHPYTGVQHPFLLDGTGTFETNPNSTACIAPDADRSTYWQGCLWGGRSGPVLELLETLSARINDDLARGVIAIWHDESHLNKFFIEHKASVNTLDPGFAFPTIWPAAPFEKKILHLEKNDEEFGNHGAGG